MKKILKKFDLSNRDDCLSTGSHIHFLHILEFANEGINFTEEETAHFDVCCVCRHKVIDTLKKMTARVPAVCGTTMRKAA